MDSLTQIVLGGAVGELVLGKKVGNKAILWGAIGGTIPDLDTFIGFFLDTVSRLDIHRGFSHSIVFAILIAPILGFLITRLYSNKSGTIWGWTQLFFWSIFTHPLLDIFTTWGTQFFWPYDWRIAIQSIFVIDPLYTLPFLVCLIAVIFHKRENPMRAKWNKLGLIMSCTYLLITVAIKVYVNSVMEKRLEKDELNYLEYDSRPTPFNTVLWTFNIETDASFLISYYSLLDHNEQLQYKEFAKNHELLKPYRNHPKVERLIQLTKGSYIIEKGDSGLLMHDLRFGLRDGFAEKPSEFVFSYLIEESPEGIKITQNQNSLKDTDKLLKALWNRIKGI